jgi:hypothetical protein
MNTDTSEPSPATPGRSPQLTSLALGDRPDAWRAAGFDVDAAGRFRLGSTTVTCTGSGDGFVSWAFDGLDPDVLADLDGLPLARVDGTGPALEAEHPNGIVSIDHVVVRTGNCDRTVAALVAAGFDVRGGRSTTSYGAPMRQTFFWAGDVILELVGPDEGEPTTDEATSIFGVALVAPDLAATGQVLGEALGTPKDAVQAGRQIAGLRNKVVGIALPIAVMSPHVSA